MGVGDTHNFSVGGVGLETEINKNAGGERGKHVRIVLKAQMHTSSLQPPPSFLTATPPHPQPPTSPHSLKSPLAIH